MSADARTDDERLVLEFFDAWDAADPDIICAYMTDDVSYADIGLPSREGRDHVLAHLRKLFGWLHVRIETLHIASRDGVVLTERYDYLQLVATGVEVKLPIMGVVELIDGKIRSWRDYSDLRTSEAAGIVPPVSDS